MLTHWARDRTRGDVMPLELLVKLNSRDPARMYGWTDRGTLEVGMRADINVIDVSRQTSCGSCANPCFPCAVQFS